MARSRTVIAVLGTAAVLLGAAAVAAPGIAASLAVPNIPVAVVGGVAALFALFVGLRRRDADLRGAEPPDVESVVEHPIPGADLDARIRGSGSLGVNAARNRRWGRERLAEVTVSVIVAVEGCSEAEAEAQLENGTWTDDPIATACFTPEHAELEWRDTVARYFDGRSAFELEFVHVVAALERKLDGEDRT